MDPVPSVGVPDMASNEDIIGKSPTTLLIEGKTGADKVFKPSAVAAYGRIAQNRYAETDIPPGAQLFKRFKMVRKTERETDGQYILYGRREKLTPKNRTRRIVLFRFPQFLVFGRCKISSQCNPQHKNKKWFLCLVVVDTCVWRLFINDTPLQTESTQSAHKRDGDRGTENPAEEQLVP